MKQLTIEDPETHSTDLVAENIARLHELLPEAFTEGRIDFDVLRQLLGDVVDDREEKYGLNWHGKRQARQLALAPSTGTLRPCPEESVDWDTTQNLMIEGDNLEVLKLLQKSYAGRVKLIYIDPPYNTGKDFVYPDNFRDSIRTYQELTGQVDGGQRITTNTESSGRFHTDWLNMMYPRLRLARNLLADDGLICISINDNELRNLWMACDDVFGEGNFVECYIWTSTFRPDNSSKVYRKNAEFVLCYAKRIETIQELVGEVIERTGLPSLTKSSMARSTLQFPAGSVIFAIPDGLYVRGERDSYELIDDVEVRDGTNVTAFRLRGSIIWGQANLLTELESGTKIIIKTEGFVPYVDKGEQGTLRPAKLIPSEKVGDVLAANAELRDLFSQNVYSYPKPISLVAYLIGYRPDQDLVLDFFAGSGTTGHAVMTSNAADGSRRRFILVQLPEPLSPDNKDQRTAANFCDHLGKPRTIAEITKERLRRAANKIRREVSMASGDLGFRVFKLDYSNIRAWEPDPDDLEGTLDLNVEHIRSGRTEADILYELLLKLGLDLCVPITTRSIASKTVYSVGAGVLIACLDEHIDREEVEPLALGIAAWHKELAPAGETTCVFRDSAFADDVAKTNLTAILEQYRLANVRSL